MLVYSTHKQQLLSCKIPEHHMSTTLIQIDRHTRRQLDSARVTIAFDKLAQTNMHSSTTFAVGPRLGCQSPMRIPKGISATCM
jgi:hypothetical protein